ncbi:MAG: hypothetical protein ABSG55_06895, partial [Dehalococcoidia bacterium]
MKDVDEITITMQPVDDDAQRLSAEEFQLVTAVHQNLIREIDLEAVEKLAPKEAREAVQVTARALLAQIAPGAYGEQVERVVRQVLNEAIGLGPIQPLVEDPSVS